MRKTYRHPFDPSTTLYVEVFQTYTGQANDDKIVHRGGNKGWCYETIKRYLHHQFADQNEYTSLRPARQNQHDILCVQTRE